ncbi:MAG: N-glycosylase/DNA lyase [Candidatus Woesearchaeota archaeon]
MDSIIDSVKRLRSDVDVRSRVRDQLEKFSSFKDLSNAEWFSELCFCLLTSNSKAMTAMRIQEELGPQGFLSHPPEEIKRSIMENKHRFHNVKTEYIVDARKHTGIKDIIVPLVNDYGSYAARDWLVKNIKGFSYKESSHFLRNVGFFDLAILDRHILNVMVENDYIPYKPKTLNRSRYLEIEKIFRKISEEINMSCAELDFYMWYMRTGKILK